MPGCALACAANSGGGGNRRLSRESASIDSADFMRRVYRESAAMPAEKIRVNILGAVLLAASAAGALATVRVGVPPPDFTLRTKQGAVPLSQLRGKPVVINFW